MFLEIITFLILVIVVISNILLARTIRDNKNILMVERTGITMMLEKTVSTSSSVLYATQRIVDNQKALDNKMNTLTKFIDQQTSYMAFQQNQFSDLARADVLSARREELLRTKELKVALERLMGVALTSRQPPAPNDVLALENLTQRIDELETILKKT